MHRELQARLVEAILGHIDAGTTCLADELTRLPVTGYTAPERLALERARLFREHPLVLGTSCRFPQPGDYVTEDRAGVPVLLVRGEDGRARAFLNVCRHRGAAVASGAGSARRVLSCPYHGWSYGLDGQLVHVPRSEAFDGIDPARHALRELPCVERHGLVWVHPAPGAPLDPDALLHGLGPELASYGLETYHHYATRAFEQPINWKIAVDTFLEPYHFGVLHKATVAPLLVHDLCLFEPFGPNLREVFPRHTIAELAHAPRGDWDLIRHSAIVYVLFPNTIWVMQLDHVELWRIYPLADHTDRCIVVLEFLIPEPVTSEKASAHWDRNLDLVLETVLAEDFPTGATIQSGLACGAQSYLTIGRNEPALAHFERAVSAAVESGACGTRPADPRVDQGGTA